MENIVLIEPQSKDDHVYKHVHMPRLGLPILGTQLKEAGYRVKFYMGTGDALPWADILEADLVGISSTTATCSEAYRIAGLLRSSNVPVVIGGIHASFYPEEAIKFADYLVRGEAENSFLPLVKAIKDESIPNAIPGVSFWLNSEPVHNPCSESQIEMDSFPVPDLILLDSYQSMRNIPIMTSRGCPFNCSFCCVTQMFGRRYRFRCTESVLQELTQYAGQQIFFCDDNFAANPAHTKELLRGIIDRGIKLKGWGAQVRADVVRDSELLDLMYRSGCSTVYIGFESINPDTLKGYNKQQSVDDIKWAISRFHDYGIRIHGMFVFGGDEDTVETIRDTADFALNAAIDSVQFMVLTPFPGTPFYNKLEEEGRILTYDWSLYDGHHAVFQPAQMSPMQLQQETVKALKKFYSLPAIFRNVALTGWASALNRVIGWGLTRHFASKNRWYGKFLKRHQAVGSKPMTLLYRSLGVLKPGQDYSSATASSMLKVTLVEQRGILYLRLRGLAGNLHLKELRSALKGFMPRYHSQVIINAEGLRFASENAAAAFGSYLERLGLRFRRLQLITAAGRQVRNFIPYSKKSQPKLPHFEIQFYKH